MERRENISSEKELKILVKRFVVLKIAARDPSDIPYLIGNGILG